MSATHEVFNQVTPLVGGNLFTGNQALQAALKFNAPGLDTAPLAQLGRVNTNGRTVYQGRYLLAWKSRPSSSHVLNIAFPPNAATSA